MKRLELTVLIVIVVALGALAWALKRSDVYLMTLCCVYLMATMGLNLTVGYAGQMSLGQAAFFGIGAYHAAILLKMGWPFFVVLPIAAVACFMIGLALGFPDMAPLPRFLSALALTCVLTYGAAWLCYRFIEEPGIALGRRIASRFRKSDGAMGAKGPVREGA